MMFIGYYFLFLCVSFYFFPRFLRENREIKKGMDTRVLPVFEIGKYLACSVFGKFLYIIEMLTLLRTVEPSEMSIFFVYVSYYIAQSLLKRYYLVDIQ